MDRNGGKKKKKGGGERGRWNCKLNCFVSGTIVTYCHLLFCLLQCDAISTLEKEHDFREEHFDFIQQYVRKFCLKCILKC